MIEVSEWLPNPVGPDSEGEWIEITNTSKEPQSLRGWLVHTESGRPFRFAEETLLPGSYRVFPRSETKLTLKNQNGAIFLVDPRGNTVQEARFFGQAPEGKSVHRAGAYFLFGEETPGEPNRVLVATVHQTLFGKGRGPGIIEQSLDAGSAALLLFSVGAIIALGALWACKKNNDLSELFFKGN